MNEDAQSYWQRGYTHLATLPCPSCRGIGTVEGFTCGICQGSKEFMAGCGGDAEVDTEHPGIGAYCMTEGRFVPREEVSK